MEFQVSLHMKKTGGKLSSLLLHKLYKLPLFINANLFVRQLAAAHQHVRHALGGEATSECTGPQEPAAGKDPGPNGFSFGVHSFISISRK